MSGLTLDVSVVIPTHDRPELLRQAIAAELAQIVRPREIIVVDNGKSSQSKMITSEFGDAVIYIRAPGQGRDASRNIGIERAGSSWISLIDDDDYHLPGFLASVEEVMQDGRANLIITDQQWFDSSGPRRSTGFQGMPEGYWTGVGRPAEAWSFVGNFPVERLLVRNPYEPGQMVVRKDLLLAVGSFDVTFPSPTGEILELNARLLSEGRLAVIWKPLLMYRRHEGNATSDVFMMDYDKLRTFEFMLDRGSRLSTTFRSAVLADLPRRRADTIRWAFERGDFALARKLLDETPQAERTLAQKCMDYVMRVPGPIARTVSWTAPKAIRNAARLAR